MDAKPTKNRGQASDPGQLRLSHEKLCKLQSELYTPQGLFRLLNRLSAKQKYWQQQFEKLLMLGDSRAAVVVSLEPLIVAAYTDELDCIAMLRFPNELVAEYHLQLGSRLLTVNSYAPGATPVADLENGPASYHRYCNFRPLIAEFLSDDITRIEARKSQISPAEWQHTTQLAQQRLAAGKLKLRDGRPMNCATAGR